MKNKDFDIPLFIKHTDMNIYMHKSTVTKISAKSHHISLQQDEDEC